MTTVRARHLFCIIGNHSHHSLESQQRLLLLQNQYKLNPNGLINLSTSCDMICHVCQYCILDRCQYRSLCDTYAKIDEFILQQLSCDPQCMYRFSEIVRQGFSCITHSHIEYICQYCPYTDKCLTYTTLHK